MDVSKSGDTGKSFDHHPLNHQITKPPNHQTTKPPNHQNTKWQNDEMTKRQNDKNEKIDQIFDFFFFNTGWRGFFWLWNARRWYVLCNERRRSNNFTKRSNFRSRPFDFLLIFCRTGAQRHDWNFVLLQIFQPMTPQVGRYPESPKSWDHLVMSLVF